MIEVLFSDSAAGSMRAAMARGLFAGDPGDILSLPLALQIGSVRPEDFWEQRARVLGFVFSLFPEGPEAAAEVLAKARDDFETFLERIAGGESVRIWTSRAPDDACGYVWFAGRLNALESCGPVCSVHLPWFEERADGTIVLRSGLGEVDPENWAPLAGRAGDLPHLLLAMMQFEWDRLARENTPLRALVNGRLLGVPADFYDLIILRELSTQPDLFNEAVAIGRILGEYQLGVSDAWIALRLEDMIRRGWLEEATSAPPDGPRYHRQLRKTPLLP